MSPTSLEDRQKRTERHVRILAGVLAVFILAHAPIIALLPKLFDHAPQPAVAAMILGVVGLALYVVSRTRQ